MAEARARINLQKDLKDEKGQNSETAPSHPQRQEEGREGETEPTAPGRYYVTEKHASEKNKKEGKKHLYL